MNPTSAPYRWMQAYECRCASCMHICASMRPLARDKVPAEAHNCSLQVHAGLPV